MYDNGDAIVSQHRLLQAGRLLLVLQGAGGKADVAGALLHGGDARAGAGGVVVHGDVLVGRHIGLAQRADDLLHGGGAVGGHRTADRRRAAVIGAIAAIVGVVVVGLIAAARQQRQRHHRSQCKCHDLLHKSITSFHMFFGYFLCMLSL